MPSNADIAAVAVTGMVPAVVAVDVTGQPLRRAILQNDARATHEIDHVRAALGDLDLLGLTGSVLSQQSVAPTALWLSRHEPDVWKRTASLQGSYDWLSRALGATAHVEYNWAIESGLYDFDANAIAAVLDATPVSWPTLLDVATPGQVVGDSQRLGRRRDRPSRRYDDRGRRRRSRPLGLRRRPGRAGRVSHQARRLR